MTFWETRLTQTSPDGIWIRGYDLLELIGHLPYPSVLYLLFKGDLPDPKVARLMDAIMVASIDHGAGAPSALAARTAISGGASLGAAGAAGLLTLGQYHGAVIDDSMRAIQRVVELQQDDDPDRSLTTFGSQGRCRMATSRAAHFRVRTSATQGAGSACRALVCACPGSGCVGRFLKLHLR